MSFKLLGIVLAVAEIGRFILRRVRVDAAARMRPRNPDLRDFDAVVESIEVSALRELPDPVLASTHLGTIPARVGANGAQLPERAHGNRHAADRCQRRS